jgi:predicted membrane metal-binding protein
MDFNDSAITIILKQLPMMIFIVSCLAMIWLSYRKNLSLIPVLGLLSCMFLMTKLGHTNWLRFLIWLGIGLVFYFTFSRKNSKLNNEIKIRDIQEQ